MNTWIINHNKCISFSLDGSFPEAYDPSFVEAKWYNHWMEQGIFNADSAGYQVHELELISKFKIIYS